MPNITVVLCDDEPSWLAQEEELLQAFAKRTGWTLSIHSYASPAELFADTASVPDVLFADIELGAQQSGMDLARMTNKTWPACQVVYVTNHVRYVSDVYETSHLWFVLKDELAARLPVIMERLNQQMEDGSRVLALETVKHELLTIPCGQIASMERRSRVTNIECQDGTVYHVPDRLAELLTRLPERIVARCHGSYAVGLAHIRMVRKESILLDTGTEVPLSRRFARTFRERYLDWMDDHAL